MVMWRNSLDFKLGYEEEPLYELEEEKEHVEESWSLSLCRMQQDQSNDEKFQKEVQILMKQHHFQYTKKEIDDIKLIHDFNRFLVPKGSQQRLLEWYHEILCRPGSIKQERTIRSIFTWNNV